jgi:hypothetical protein
MPRLSLYFHPNFADENWQDFTYFLEAPADENGHGHRGEWVLGRHPASDLTVAIRNVSRRHAVIAYSYAADCWSLEDLGSDGGTFLNGKRLQKGDRPPLNVGDKIYLANHLISVVEDDWDTAATGDEVGPSTIASTTPIDYRPVVEPAPAPAPAPAPKTYADTAYLALQWTITPTTPLGVAVRLVVVAMASLVVVLVLQ